MPSPSVVPVPPPPREWLSVAEVGELLRISAPAVYRAVYRGQLKAYKLGRRVRLKRVEVEAAMIELKPNS